MIFINSNWQNLCTNFTTENYRKSTMKFLNICSFLSNQIRYYGKLIYSTSFNQYRTKAMS